MTMDQYELS